MLPLSIIRFNVDQSLSFWNVSRPFYSCDQALKNFLFQLPRRLNYFALL
jgi:hypothetical protein